MAFGVQLLKLRLRLLDRAGQHWQEVRQRLRPLASHTGEPSSHQAGMLPCKCLTGVQQRLRCMWAPVKMLHTLICQFYILSNILYDVGQTLPEPV